MPALPRLCVRANHFCQPELWLLTDSLIAVTLSLLKTNQARLSVMDYPVTAPPTPPKSKVTKAVKLRPCWGIVVAMR